MTTTQLPDTASPSPLEVDLAVLPKVSLHDHLDGGLRVGTVLDLAREARRSEVPDIASRVSFERGSATRSRRPTPRSTSCGAAT